MCIMAVCLISFDLLWFKRVLGAYSATAITFLLDIALPGGIALSDCGCFFVFVDTGISSSAAIVLRITHSAFRSTVQGVELFIGVRSTMNG